MVLAAILTAVFLQATTSLDPRVLDAMLPYLTEKYGNPHSRTHAYGWEAESDVEAARKVGCTECGWAAEPVAPTSFRGLARGLCST